MIKGDTKKFKKYFDSEDTHCKSYGLPFVAVSQLLSMNSFVQSVVLIPATK